MTSSREGFVRHPFRSLAMMAMQLAHLRITLVLAIFTAGAMAIAQDQPPRWVQTDQETTLK